MLDDTAIKLGLFDMSSAYSIFNDTSEEGFSGFQFLDGDMKKVAPVGFDFHPVTHRVKLPDGTSVRRNEFYQGVPVDATHLPTKVVWKDKKRRLSDFRRAHNIFIVSELFRSTLEELEPGVHQFKPVKLVWADGQPAGDFFWFYPCNRIDGMDRALTSLEFREDTGRWKTKPGGKYVVNLAQIGDRHIWIDPRMAAFDLPFVSKAFKRAMTDAGVKGIGYSELAAI
jgi:hypothetical protein